MVLSKLKAAGTEAALQIFFTPLGVGEDRQRYFCLSRIHSVKRTSSRLRVLRNKVPAGCGIADVLRGSPGGAASASTILLWDDGEGNGPNSVWYAYNCRCRSAFLLTYLLPAAARFFRASKSSATAAFVCLSSSTVVARLAVSSSVCVLTYSTQFPFSMMPQRARSLP